MAAKKNIYYYRNGTVKDTVRTNFECPLALYKALKTYAVDEELTVSCTITNLIAEKFSLPEYIVIKNDAAIRNLRIANLEKQREELQSQIESIRKQRDE